MLHQRPNSVLTKSRNRTPLAYATNDLQRVTEEPYSLTTSRYGTVTHTRMGSKINSGKNSVTDRGEFEPIGEQNNV